MADLVTLDEAKDFIGRSASIVKDDASLEIIRKGVLARADKHTGRALGYQSDVEEELDADGEIDTIVVDSFPINKTTSIDVYEDSERVFNASALLTENDDYVVDHAKGLVVSESNNWLRGKRVIKVKYSGGYLGETATSVTGATVIPSDLREAILAQVSHVFQIRNELGGSRVTTGGETFTQQEGYDLLPGVERVFRSYRRLIP